MVGWHNSYLEQVHLITTPQYVHTFLYLMFSVVVRAHLVGQFVTTAPFYNPFGIHLHRLRIIYIHKLILVANKCRNIMFKFETHSGLEFKVIKFKSKCVIRAGLCSLSLQKLCVIYEDKLTSFFILC